MRYIDPYKLAREVRKSQEDNPHKERLVAHNHHLEHDHFIELIMRAPSEDVLPVVHARWIKNTEMRRVDGHIYDYCCSACGGFAQKGCYNNYDKLTPYCAECGAKMEERIEQYND